MFICLSPVLVLLRRGAGFALRLALMAALLFPAAAPAVQPATAAPNANIIYVKAGATGAATGSTWNDAFPRLESALAAAASGDQIWMASGVYTPTIGGAFYPTATFTLTPGVAIYGGFAGGETDLAQRNWETNLTTLSCDIAGDDPAVPNDTNPAAYTDNCYHVVHGADGASLDGLTIRGGAAINDPNPCSVTTLIPVAGCGGGVVNIGEAITLTQAMTLTNVVLRSNLGNVGAAVINVYGRLALQHVTVRDNASNMMGAVINAIGQAQVNDVDFISNRSQGYGGGLTNVNGWLHLEDVTFTRNTSQQYGGGLMNSIQPGQPGSEIAGVSLNNVLFNRNTAVLGGGLMSMGGPITLTQVTFARNSVSMGYGGGMTLMQGSAVLNDVAFNDNSGYQAGGGLMTMDSAITLTQVTFTGNQAQQMGGGWASIDDLKAVAHDLTLTRNSTMLAGGGIINQGSVMTLTQVTFVQNDATGMAGGSNIGGGGMANIGSSPVLTDLLFEGNTSLFGGGMMNVGGSPRLNNVTFRDNASGAYGGGVFNDNGSSPILNKVVFERNSASIIGGGMTSSDCLDVQLNDVVFEQNQANMYGGALAYITGSGRLNNVTLRGNQADNQGGGIYASSAALAISNALASGNQALNGAGIYSAGSSLRLTNVTLSGNQADDTGGGLYNQAASVWIGNSILWGNEGGEVYNLGSPTPVITHSLVQGGYGLGNLDLDPLFVEPVSASSAPTITGNLRLGYGSPAIDAGLDSLITTTLDLAGNPRIFGAAVDLGAYETMPAVIAITRAAASPTSAPSAPFTVTFNMPVSGVDLTDFSLAATGGQAGASLASLSGADASYVISVTTVANLTGTIGLDLIDDDSILAAPAMPLGGPGLGNGDFAGPVYQVDRRGPSVTHLEAPDVTTAGNMVYTLTVTYEDPDGVVFGTLDGNDLRVSGPDGFDQPAAFVSAAPAGDGSPITAVYHLIPPGGSWSILDNGTYTVSLQSGQIADGIANVSLAAAVGNFRVDIPNPGGPIVTHVTTPNVNVSGGTVYTLTVTYEDSDMVKFGSLDGNDLQVSRSASDLPPSFSQLASFVRATPAADGNSITAVYRLTPPGGRWDPTDNGVYVVNLLGGQVLDVGGTAAQAAGVSAFVVIIDYGLYLPYVAR